MRREAGIGSCTRVTISAFEVDHPGPHRGPHRAFSALRRVLVAAALLAPAVSGIAQSAQPVAVPPRVAQARRFLAHRGWSTNRANLSVPLRANRSTLILAADSVANTSVWQPLGPQAVLTSNYGLVTGRVSSIAIDPSDPTGNRVLIGTTGGGVWSSQNAGASGSVLFAPLTDAPSAFDAVRYASISIGALTVQPGGTGVILAGTGDPNDALDSYYGAGILRSTDNGNTWSLISHTSDLQFLFQGEGFGGFAWSTVNPQLVVAAVAQAYEGALVNAPMPGSSYAGLYYSTNAGATWSLATITDRPAQDVQGPLDAFVGPNGNSATAVVWNPVRQMFIAAVRFHGYYQSADGIHWQRMPAQPGSGLSLNTCPTNIGMLGSIACPIFRGALAVNPVTGDTFAWTVDLNNQDQGLWQDQCAITAGRCSNQTVAFQKPWSTNALETNTSLGASTIANGDYNLVLAAVPSAQDTLLLAGANDLWSCSLAVGCTWRNTTNANTCMSAQVAPYQHAIAWNPANPQEIFVGNDSGLWRSNDAIAETGSVCSSSDATHYQNLNSGIGPLAEVESISQVGDSSYTMMAGLGVNGTAGTTSTSGPTQEWPQILGGEGGPVASDSAGNWYVNNSAGVSIYRCSSNSGCTPADFGAAPVVNSADVSRDGDTMTTPAPFIVDPLDNTQLLVGTCRLWRGTADGSPWAAGNAISSIFDRVSGLRYCSGDALIRAIAALPLLSGGEVIYVGMYGAFDGGGTLAGHILKTTYNPSKSGMPTWQDLTFNPVVNNQNSFNYFGLDISSIFVDPHDNQGNTVYVTITGVEDIYHEIQTVYRTTDGGAHWTNLTANLPHVPANSVVIDPQDANTAYVATDEAVFTTRQVANCGNPAVNCWSVFGAGLPYSPVTQLSAAPATTSPNVLVAGTYGRGVWQIPLWTAGAQLTTATAQPTSIDFAAQSVGSTSAAQTITLTNTGGIALTVTSISASANFSETDNCTTRAVDAGATCAIQVTFTPDHTGSISGQLIIGTNISGGQITIPLAGTGSSAGVVTASPGSLDFGQVQVGTTSPTMQVTMENAGATPVPITGVTVTPPFAVAANACGSSMAANSDCALSLAFAPTQAGSATGTLTIADSAGTQTVALSGSGASVATDELSPTSITFSATIAGQLSSPQIVTLTNNGDLPLASIALTTTAGFQASSTCGTILTGHASCAISVLFAPTVAGTQNGTLHVSDALRTQAVPLSGMALQPPAIGVSPSQLTFPAEPVGQTSSPLALTISNSGGAPMSNVGFQITGQSAAGFSWSSSTCGATLNNGSNCTVQVLFTPASAGPFSAKLVVSSSTQGVSPVQVPLSGIGQSASGITIAPSQMTFTQAALGQESAPQTATITNSTSMSVTGLVLTATAPFTLIQNSCSATLAAGASCTTGIVFTPTANGSITGTLTVSSSSFANAASAVLTGIGGAAGSIQIQPAGLNFPTTGVGNSSVAQTVTLTNNGQLALGSLLLFTSGAFQVASNTCGASIPVGSSCSVTIAFAPSSAGQQSGNLTVTNPALATNIQVPLSGMGFDFSISTQGQSSLTVASGQTASYVIVFTPMNGSNGAFSFACSSLPANSVCSFNPPSESVAANTSGSVTVQIATGLASSAQNLPTHTLDSGGRLFLALGVLILPLAVGRKRHRLLVVLALLAGIGGLAGITGCAGSGGGGGGSLPSNPHNTPAGTYSVVVTAASNGVSHKVTLTLTVD